jgi:hypothetical protein
MRKFNHIDTAYARGYNDEILLTVFYLMDKRIVIIFSLIIFALSGFASINFRAQIAQENVKKNVSTTISGSFVDSGPRTEACPLNGELYSKEQKDDGKVEDHLV